MFNLTVLSGRLTQDPELKNTLSGLPVTSFTIAVERKTKNEAGERETDFINIVAWRKTAELIIKWFKKGDMIGIEGSIQTRKYTDKQGNNRTAFEVVANNIQFMNNKKEDNTASPDPLPALQETIAQQFPEPEDDLPF